MSAARTYSFYHFETGLFSGRITCAPEHVTANTPDGYRAIEGVYDPLSQKVAEPGGAGVPTVVDYIPDAPADTELATYAWDAEIKRWVATPTLAANKLARKVPVQAEIDALEANDSHQRSLREILLAVIAEETPPSESVTALGTIDAEIAVLRATLDAIDAAATQEELDAIE